MAFSIVIALCYTYVCYFVGVVSAYRISYTASFVSVGLLFGLLYLGIYIRSAIQSAVERSDTASKFDFWNTLRSRLGPAVLVLSLIPVLYFLNRSPKFSHHPIDGLLSYAVPAHEKWIKQASSSESLEEAVRNYRARYSRYPPP